TVRVPIAVCGGGAAGSAAAQVLAQRGASFLLLEREGVLGGRLVNGATGPDALRPPEARALPQGSVRLNTTAIGLYDDADGRYLAAVSHGPEGARLLKVYAEQFLLTVGGHPQLPPFENNDLPGIFSGQAVSALIRRHGLLPGEQAAVVGEGEELAQVARLLEQHGAKLVAVVDTAGQPRPGAHPRAVHGRELKARGRSEVAGLAFTRGDGERVKVRCDVIAVAMPPSPAFELARQGGANVEFLPELGVFGVMADEHGRTSAKGLFVAGDARGGMSAVRAVESGRKTAEAMLGGAR
ncbi:MAG TPA: FAD-dependent oxidoreductase, partial [Myxococcaceae bacterium]|nr:FAD-dependent oxidoreductase [Myxococcaceae bacterium]